MLNTRACDSLISTRMIQVHFRIELHASNTSVLPLIRLTRESLTPSIGEKLKDRSKPSLSIGKT